MPHSFRKGGTGASWHFILSQLTEEKAHILSYWIRFISVDGELNLHVLGLKTLQEGKQCVRYQILWFFQYTQKLFWTTKPLNPFHSNTLLNHTSSELTTKFHLIQISPKKESCVTALAELPPTNCYQVSMLNSKQRFSI